MYPAQQTNTHSRLSVNLAEIDAADLFYSTAYCLWLIAGILNASLFARYINGAPYNAMRVACYALLLLVIIVEFRNHERSLTSLLLVIFLTVSVFQFDRLVLLDTVVFVFCGRYRDFSKLAKITIMVVVAMLLLVILSSRIGLINDYTIGSAGGRFRHYLGFRYALRGPQLLFSVTTLVVYLKEGHLRYLGIAALILSNLILFVLTDSRSIFYLALILFILCVLPKGFIERICSNRLVGTVLVSSFILAAAVSILCTAMYNPDISWMNVLDSSDYLAGRLSMGKQALDNYGIALFGQEVETVGRGLDLNGQRYSGSFFYIDSLYIRLLVNYGFVAFLAFVGGFTLVMHNAWKSKMWWILIPCVIVAMHCMFDDLSIYLTYNTFLLLIGKVGLNGFSASPSPYGTKEDRR